MVRRGRAGVSGCPEHTHCAHSSDGGRGTRGRPPPRPRTIYTRPAPTRPHRSARHAPTARNAHAPPRGEAGGRGGRRPRRMRSGCRGRGRVGKRLRLATSPRAVGARLQSARADVGAHVRSGGGAVGAGRAPRAGAGVEREGFSGEARAPRRAPPRPARAWSRPCGEKARESARARAHARGQRRSRAGRKGTAWRMRGSDSFRHGGGGGVGSSDVAWRWAGFVTALRASQRRERVVPSGPRRGSLAVTAMSFRAVAALRGKQRRWGCGSVPCGFCQFFAPKRLVIKTGRLSVFFFVLLTQKCGFL